MRSKLIALLFLAFSSVNSNAGQGDGNVSCQIFGESQYGEPIFTEVSSQIMPHLAVIFGQPRPTGDFTFSSGGYLLGSNTSSPGMVVGNSTGQIRFSDPEFPQVNDSARFYIAISVAPTTADRATRRQQYRLNGFTFGSEARIFIPYSEIRDQTLTREINLPEIIDGRIVTTPVTLFCNVTDS